MSNLRIYIAGKVSKESVFGTHHWRDEFAKKLEELSGRNLQNIDPLNGLTGDESASTIFRHCIEQIKQCDLFIVYLSDDISVGGSQEILIAKYLKKPTLGFAPYGGKFNGCKRVMFGKEIEDFKDPFVFSTCDVVCGTIEEVAEALKNFEDIKPKNITIIDEALGKSAAS